MSTTWKSLTAGFGLGVVSTGIAATISLPVGALLWGGSLVYIGYKYYEASKGES
jgi:hypothetical protein